MFPFCHLDYVRHICTRKSIGNGKRKTSKHGHRIQDHSKRQQQVPLSSTKQYTIGVGGKKGYSYKHWGTMDDHGKFHPGHKRMGLVRQRAGCVGNDELYAVDSTSISTYGFNLIDIRWGKNFRYNLLKDSDSLRFSDSSMSIKLRWVLNILTIRWNPP